MNFVSSFVVVLDESTSICLDLSSPGLCLQFLSLEGDCNVWEASLSWPVKPLSLGHRPRPKTELTH